MLRGYIYLKKSLILKNEGTGLAWLQVRDKPRLLLYLDLYLSTFFYTEEVLFK